MIKAKTVHEGLVLRFIAYAWRWVFFLVLSIPLLVRFWGHGLRGALCTVVTPGYGRYRTRVLDGAQAFDELPCTHRELLRDTGGLGIWQLVEDKQTRHESRLAVSR